MSPSADELLAAVAHDLIEMERLCAEFLRAVDARDWARIAQNVADARRTLHSLENAMGAATAVRTEPIDREIFSRMQRVQAARVTALDAMKRVRDETATRLSTIARAKAFGRSIMGRDRGNRGARLLDNLR